MITTDRWTLLSNSPDIDLPRKAQGCDALILGKQPLVLLHEEGTPIPVCHSRGTGTMALQCYWPTLDDFQFFTEF